MFDQIQHSYVSYPVSVSGEHINVFRQSRYYFFVCLVVFKWSYDFRSRTSVIWKLFLGPPCFYQKFSLICSQVLLSSWRTSPGTSGVQLLRLHGPLDSMDLRLHRGACISIQKQLISWCLVLVYKATAPQKKTQWPKSSWNISSCQRR